MDTYVSSNFNMDDVKKYSAYIHEVIVRMDEEWHEYERLAMEKVINDG